MRRSKFILLAMAFILICTVTACAHMPGPDKEALARILGRRIGQHGTQLYPGIFLGLGITAGQACKQVTGGATTPDMAFSLIAIAIEKKTDDPFLAYDLKDVIEIMGIDLNKSFEVINLTPATQGALLQFICSFAQGVDRVKQNL